MSEVVTVKTGTAVDVDIQDVQRETSQGTKAQEHRRCHAGDMFGEKAVKPTC